MIRFLVWDWHAGLAPEQLIQAIAAFEHRLVYAIGVETGTDSYVVALSDHPISAFEARQVWERG